MHFCSQVYAEELTQYEAPSAFIPEAPSFYLILKAVNIFLRRRGRVLTLANPVSMPRLGESLVIHCGATDLQDFG